MHGDKVFAYVEQTHTFNLAVHSHALSKHITIHSYTLTHHSKEIMYICQNTVSINKPAN